MLAIFALLKVNTGFFMSEEKKRIVTPLEVLLLAIAIFILISIGLQQCGVKVFYRKDDTHIIHKPHQ